MKPAQAKLTPVPQPSELPKLADNRLAVATALIAKTRADCVALGLSPSELADLLLPEALLAMMVHGMSQEEVEDAFARFARDEIGAWFFRVKRIAGYCDCEREAFAEHAAHCTSHRNSAIDLIPPTTEDNGTNKRSHDAKLTTGGSQ